MSNRLEFGRTKRPLIAVASALAALIAFGGQPWATAHAAPQDDNMEWILQYGPDTDMFKLDGIERALQAWKWQLELSKTQQELVDESVQLLAAQVKENEEQIRRLQEVLAEAGIPATIDNETVAGIHQAIRVHRGELSGLEAKLVELEINSKYKIKELHFERDSARREMDLLHSKASALKTELISLNKLKEKGYASKDAIVQVEARLEEVEASFENTKDRNELLESRMKNGDKQASIVGVVSQMKLLESGLEELTKQKEAIVKTNPLQKMERLNREIEMSTKMLHVARMKSLELQLESTRNQALILLTEKRLAASKAEAGDQNDEKDDSKKDKK